MITKELVAAGFEKGIIKLVVDPNLEAGTVCQIGENWFYFGGMTAEEESPEDFIRNTPREVIISDIFDVLESFSWDGFNTDEYLYYDFYLHEQLGDTSLPDTPKASKGSVQFRFNVSGQIAVEVEDSGDSNDNLCRAILAAEKTFIGSIPNGLQLCP